MTRKGLTGLLLTLALVGTATLTTLHAPGARAGAPDKCIPGYVWRGAYTGDYVCVLPATRSTNWYWNTQVLNTTNPYGYCYTGYVWRQARPSDHVCVPPAVRTQAAYDNSRAELTSVN